MVPAAIDAVGNASNQTSDHLISSVTSKPIAPVKCQSVIAMYATINTFLVQAGNSPIAFMLAYAALAALKQRKNPSPVTRTQVAVAIMTDANVPTLTGGLKPPTQMNDITSEIITTL
eukprot:CAMPEP_0184485664 /NCGR_PEP_ID=MMETSP0113_2-20130426/7240_1 /TAXON_ID=91329 /ORGANISM="Norrisiella sphaerica, Strain BC52" /LENGTH=116 /DNA_ID=CAMNT_0026867205 /DNA_START=1034 /DNA_END=1384 /DNA_ORIENTATION=-